MDRKDQELDDILDNLDFKPITEGLGFHHSLKEKKQVKTELNIQSEALKNEFETRVKNLTKENMPDETQINRGELAPFYEQSVSKAKEEKIILREDTQTEDTVEVAGFIHRFGAWLIDVSLIVSSLILIFTGIIYFSEFPLKHLSVMMITGDILSSLLFITFSLYLFYFAVLDKTSYSTFGKNVVGLKVVGIDNKEISLIRSFIRTFIVICAIPFLGLPLLFDVANILTDTQVIKK